MKKRGEKKTTPPGDGKAPARRGKSRSRSPVQHHRRTPSSAAAALPAGIQVRYPQISVCLLSQRNNLFFNELL